MNFLLKEFYLPDKALKPRILISSGFGFSILLILVVFSPFGMLNIKTFVERFIVASGYSLIAFFTWLIVLVISRKFQPDKIKLWELLFLLFVIQVLIATLCTIYNNIIFHNPYYFEFLLHFQMIVHLTGIIPTIMLFLFLETSYYDTISLKEKTDNDSFNNTGSQYPLIRIEDENPAKSMMLPANEIISISSMDNYLKVVSQKNGEIQKSVVIRGTLKNVEKDILDTSYLIKCHRSHIVNLFWVQRISGNSLNKKLHMKIGNIEIPISRTKVDEVIKKFRLIN
jgi:DNA-binding LytR/AlgR family response regulator